MAKKLQHIGWLNLSVEFKPFRDIADNKEITHCLNYCDSSTLYTIICMFYVVSFALISNI